MTESSDPALTHPRPAAFGHVFVATDFTPGAARALARAAQLPLAEEGKVSIVHVLPDLPEKARAHAEKEARKKLDEAVSELRKSVRSDLVISAEVCRGKPYVEIIQRARAAGAELIVLGRHGERPLRDILIGTTAERVIRTGELPVLVVTRKGTHGYRRSLLAIDLEDTSQAVVSTALRALGPDVKATTLIHAFQVPFEGFIAPGASRKETSDIRKEYAGVATEGVRAVQAQLAELGVSAHPIIVRGDARSAILAAAVQCDADLLVVATHGRSGLAHALLGSVAEWVIQAAETDVLVARPPKVSFELP